METLGNRHIISQPITWSCVGDRNDGYNNDKSGDVMMIVKVISIDGDGVDKGGWHDDSNSDNDIDGNDNDNGDGDDDFDDSDNEGDDDCGWCWPWWLQILINYSSLSQ